MTGSKNRERDNLLSLLEIFASVGKIWATHNTKVQITIKFYRYLLLL